MTAAKTWNAHIVIGEHDDGSTYAEARLVPQDQVTLVGVGTARLNPNDRNVPEIGDEVAAARALADLAHRLLNTAVEDIADVTTTWPKSGSAIRWRPRTGKESS